MLTQGLGIYISKIHRCEDGLVSTITHRAQDLGFSYVILKIAQSSTAYNVDLAGPLVDSLKASGIYVYGWQTIFCSSPDEEARIACHRINLLGLDGFVFLPEENVHIEREPLIKYLDQITADRVGVPVGISSHRFPFNYPWFPWKDCLQRIQMIIPRIFWGHSSDPASQLMESLREYSKMSDLPIHPTGGGFDENSWMPTPQEIRRFRDTVFAQGLTSCNLWSWDTIPKDSKRILDSFTQKGAYTEISTSTPIERLFSRLNDKKIEDAIKIYDQNAKIVTEDKVYNGHREIFTFFSSLIETTPAPIFHHEILDDNGPIKFVRWSCFDEKGALVKPPSLNTFIIQHGLISYQSLV